jgi:hypothetical protein
MDGYTPASRQHQVAAGGYSGSRLLVAAVQILHQHLVEDWKLILKLFILQGPQRIFHGAVKGIL